jgi:hypothetical protein
MVAMETKTISVTIATTQPHFASSRKKRKKKSRFALSIIFCEQGGMNDAFLYPFIRHLSSTYNK